MSKSTTRTVVVLALATISLSSYIFLNTVAPNTSSSSDLESEETKNEVKALENVESALPDVMLLKKVIEVGKRILPAS